MRKAEELREQLRRRTGVVLLGPPGAGKTTVWRLLRTALGIMESAPSLRVHIFNPKAVTRRQLLGHVDPDTREWTDGILSACVRQVVAELPGQRTSCASYISFPQHTCIYIFFVILVTCDINTARYLMRKLCHLWKNSFKQK